MTSMINLVGMIVWGGARRISSCGAVPARSQPIITWQLVRREMATGSLSLDRMSFVDRSEGTGKHRFYVENGIRYPSVTTVLGKTREGKPAEWLKK